ncbi:MAG: hypothetical protein WCJ66_02025 [Verrucomicrobiota bacterium]
MQKQTPRFSIVLNGVQVGLGTCDAVSNPNLISGPGSLQVTDNTRGHFIG